MAITVARGRRWQKGWTRTTSVSEDLETLWALAVRGLLPPLSSGAPLRVWPLCESWGLQAGAVQGFVQPHFAGARFFSMSVEFWTLFF